MPGLKLYTSNRAEVLLDRLIELLRVPLSDPLQPETILVQSRGMEQWLKQQLACRLGIWANGRFPFPNTAARDIFKAVLPALPDTSIFSQEYLVWRVLKLLPSCAEMAVFHEIRQYLINDPHGLKHWQLAQRIAATLDNYLLYRPDMLLAWEGGEGEDWQPVLWRSLVSDAGSGHRAALRFEFLEQIKKPGFAPEGLPERISVYGIPYLPAFHLEVLTEVSRFVQVHLFLLVPSPNDRKDLAGEAAALKGIPGIQADTAAAPRFRFRHGNAMLDSWGSLGREFHSRIMRQEIPVLGWSHYEENGEDNLLHRIQSDILFDRDRTALPADGDRSIEGGNSLFIHPDDRSVQIHSCHSPTREVEVFHDRLLDLFERYSNLEPRDVLVMIPDIESYAPVVEAVFGTVQNKSRNIPFSISDRGAVSENALIRTFFKILDFKTSRFEATRVIDLLEGPPVLRRFDLKPADLECIVRWVNEAGIRWGINGQDRARCNVPDFEENSWEYGFQRMLLGFAMPGAEQLVFDGILPYDEIEGGESLVFGRFLEFTKRLFQKVQALDEKRSLSAWQAVFCELIDSLMAPDEDTREDLQVLMRELHILQDIQQKSGFVEPVSLELVRSYLEQALGREGLSRAFLSGGVTFCSMLPMRSIPFRVVALLGMNHDAFPRAEHPFVFDKVSASPRPGDRSLRDEHRYLFLEALLSARDCLYISYVGQSIRDNSTAPPSVLVSELIDYIRQGIAVGLKAQDGADGIVVRHLLQPFNPTYFLPGKDPRDSLFSYSEENCQALTTCTDRAWWTSPFFVGELPEPEAADRIVSLEALKRFYCDPVAFFFKERFGLRIEKEAEELLDHEPLGPDALADYRVKQAVVTGMAEGRELDSLLRSVRLSGVLPPRRLGEIHMQSIVEEARSIAKRVIDYASPKFLEDLQLELRLAAFLLTGKIGGIRENGLLRYRCAYAQPKDFMSAWIDFLAMWSAGRPGDPRSSILFDRKEQWQFVAMDDNPEELLGALLENYWQGLSKPLPAFPWASMAYAETLHKSDNREAALSSARIKWTQAKANRRAPESEEPYNKLAFRDTDPLDKTFEQLARRIWIPLVKHRRDA